MRYALISDIHANLPALEAVLDHIAATPDITATYHLGDLVGYAPWPDETVALLRSRGIDGVSGNYDSTVATDYKHCGCKYEDPLQEELSHLSFAWTKEHTSPETKRFLATLPFRLDVKPNGGHAPGPTIVLVHGTPTLNTVYWTEDRPDSFCLQMASLAGAKSSWKETVARECRTTAPTSFRLLHHVIHDSAEQSAHVRLLTLGVRLR